MNEIYPSLQNKDKNNLKVIMAASSGSKILSKILQNFPPECNYAFAYGSGVFLQKNQKPGKMVDLIFVVDDPVKWHTKNLQLNRSHYSGIRVFGPKVIADIQERMACGIYYNPFVKVEDILIKYGVMSTTALQNDLINWSHIYVAGRLHKPVLDIVGPKTNNLKDSIIKNRDAALRTALLLNSRCIRKVDLYHTITEISYMGDFRMKFGEHPDKVKNIVAPLVPHFDQIYFPLLEKLKPYVKIDKTGIITQDIDPNGRLQQLMGLPFPIQRSLARRIYRDPRQWDVEDAMVELSHVPNVASYIRQSIMDVVWGASILQTAQGILSAGVIRSIRYGFEKIMKKVTAKPTTSSSSSLTSSPIQEDLLLGGKKTLAEKITSSEPVLLIEPNTNSKLSPPTENITESSHQDDNVDKDKENKQVLTAPVQDSIENDSKKPGRKSRKVETKSKEDVEKTPKTRKTTQNNSQNIEKVNESITSSSSSKNSNTISPNINFKRRNTHKPSEMNEA